MDYSKKTADLIERMCRNVEREDFILDKEKGSEAVLKTYDLFELPRPKKIVWCKDIFEQNFQDAAGSARSARSAWSAGSARSAWSAGSARSARSAWSAGSARSAGSAWSARSARSAGSAWSAGSAGSAWSALDYDFDWFVFEFEYCQNPDADKLPNENDKKYLKYSELLMQAKEYGVGYRIEWEDVLYLVPTPIVKLNAENRYHADNGSSLFWKDGEKFYYLNGVNLKEDLYNKVTSGTMPFEEILKIEDVDQRTQAMRFGDLRKFLEHTKATKLDEATKQSKGGKTITYELYSIPQGEVFNETVHYIVYSCPSTDKEYMSGVPVECKTVKEAMAWKISDPDMGYVVSPEEWDSQIPLIHES